MLPRLHLFALGVIISAAALLTTAPAALADPWSPCNAHAPEDQTVRVFPRAASAAGPTGTSSELQCGNHFYGVRRIETEWTGIPAWQATADAAIGRALSAGHTPVHDRHSDTWTYRAPGVVVVTRPRGLIVDALPAAP